MGTAGGDAGGKSAPLKKRAVSQEAGSPGGSSSVRKKKKAPAGAGESVSRM